MPVHITPLTPLALLERSADVFAGATAVVDGDRRLTYRELADEVTRVAQRAAGLGAAPGRPGRLPLPERHGAAGGALRGARSPGSCWSRSTRALAPEEVRSILAHSGARMLVVDVALAGTVAPVLDRLGVEEIVVGRRRARPRPGTAYADLVARGSDEPLPWTRRRRGRARSRSTTPRARPATPKGVMYTHRGAYLNALGENITHGHGAGHRLPVDAADVPLQRLVPPVGDRRRSAAPRCACARCAATRCGR